MTHTHNPAGACTIGVFFRLLLVISLLLASTAANADFYLTRNQNPFTLFQGQPLPLPTQVDATGYSFGLDIANTLNEQDVGNQSLIIDFESKMLNLRLQRPLLDDFAIIVDLPLLHRGGGVFDNAIDSWHDFFGLPRANRPNVADNQFLLQYSVSGNDAVLVQSGGSSVGDIAVHLGYHLHQGAVHNAALWLGVELPSGDSAQLAGNDATDFHLTLASSHAPTDDVQFNINLGAVFPGDDLFSANPANDVVAFGYLASQWHFNDWLQLRLQLEYHGSYFRDSRLKLLDAATVIVFGGAIVIDSCNRFDIGVSEDIDVGASPDISLLLNWQYGCSRSRCQQ